MLKRAIVLAAAIAGGLLASQGPEFAQQYRQRLGGVLDEVAREVARFDAEAADNGLDRSTGLARLQAEADPLARRRGDAVADDVARAARLTRQIEAMRAAGGIGRLVAMAGDFDPEVARRAWGDFEPAAPLSVEALTVGALGGLGGGLVAGLLAAPFGRRRRPAPAAPAPPLRAANFRSTIDN